MENVKILIIISLNMLFYASSCEKSDINDDELILVKNNYVGQELKTEGFYYHTFQSDKESANICFFFRNGVYFTIGSPNLDEINDKEIINRYIKYSKNTKYSWGLFQIEGDTIKYEKWVPVEGPLVAVTYEGKILNDTTFIVDNYYRMINGQKVDLTKIDWIYHFKEFSPKPDSTNSFIK